MFVGSFADPVEDEAPSHWRQYLEHLRTEPNWQSLGILAAT